MKLNLWTSALLLLLATQPVRAEDWTRESKDRAKRAALHDSAQLVRGDSGKWSDDARLLHAPPIEQKPAKLALDAWVDQLLEKKAEVTDRDDNWLVFRSEQFDDNDRIWVDRIERKGQQITVIASKAKWQGKYFRNFTYYQVIALKLGKLEPGKYDVKWVIQPFVFTKFDGDGRPLETNWPRDEKPADKKPTEMRLTFEVGARPR